MVAFSTLRGSKTVRDMAGHVAITSPKQHSPEEHKGTFVCVWWVLQKEGQLLAADESFCGCSGSSRVFCSGDSLLQTELRRLCPILRKSCLGPTLQILEETGAGVRLLAGHCGYSVGLCCALGHLQECTSVLVENWW